MRAPAAVHVVAGYSQAGRFDGIVAESTAGPIVIKARWQPMARAAMFYENGRISEWLTRLLLEMRQLRRTDAQEPTPFYLAWDPLHNVAMPAYYEPRNAERLVLMLYLGEPDLFHIAHALYPRYDFTLDPQIPGLQAIPPHTEWQESIDTEIVRDMIRLQFDPLFKAMMTLREAGFRNLFLHEVPPPATERKIHWPHWLRFKLTVLANEIFTGFARSHDIGFISVWNQVTENGVRTARYDEGDGVHLNQAAAMLSIAQMHAMMGLS
jgi:hypothetical protein